MELFWNTTEYRSEVITDDPMFSGLVRVIDNQTNMVSAVISQEEFDNQYQLIPEGE